jgi:hypothetical protein
MRRVAMRSSSAFFYASPQRASMFSRYAYKLAISLRFSCSSLYIAASFAAFCCCAYVVWKC